MRENEVSAKLKETRMFEAKRVCAFPSGFEHRKEVA
jgi:hypothetical protein